MKFFQAVDIAEWCFLSEAVFFLAFGQIPEAQWYDLPVPDEEGNLVGIDQRFHWKLMPDNFVNKQTEFEFFQEEDFSVAGLSMPKGYFEAASSILWGEIAEAKHEAEFFEEYAHKLKENLENYDELHNKYKAAKLKLENAKSQIQLFKDANAQFEVHLEKTWAHVFQGIHTGALKVQAIDLQNWERLSDEDLYREAGEFVDVPAEAFRLNHNFYNDEVNLNGREYAATRLNVEELIDFWGARFSKGTDVEASEYGHAVLVRNDGPARALRVLPRRRGAPQKINWDLLREQFEEMKQSGRLPQKKEACIQYLIEFAEKTLGSTVGRSTVQLQLRHEFDEYYNANN